MNSYDVRVTFTSEKLTQEQGEALWRFASGFSPLAGAYRLRLTLGARTPVSAIMYACDLTRMIVSTAEIEAVEAELLRNSERREEGTS